MTTTTQQPDTPLPDGMIDEERLKAITALTSGAHDAPEQGLCVMEAVAFVRRMPHTDQPECVHPVLGIVARVINDWMLTDELRTSLLLPFVPRLVGTSQGDTERMLTLLIDAAVTASGDEDLRGDWERDARADPEEAADSAICDLIIMRHRTRAGADDPQSWDGPLAVLDSMIAAAKAT